MNNIRFRRKPMPLYAELRPLYKISQLLLVLDIASRGKRANLIKLHLFSWVLKTEQREKILLESAEQGKILFGFWGIDPAVNVALQFAMAEGFVFWDKGAYKISEKGTLFIRKSDLHDLFIDEVKFLKAIGNKITDTMINDVTNDWV